MKCTRMLLIAAVVTGVVFSSGLANAAHKAGTEYPWSVSAFGGFKDFEGDEMIDDTVFMGLGLSYDYSVRWTFELIAHSYPSIKGSMADVWGRDANNNLIKIDEDNRLLKATGVADTSAIGLSLECLYHLTRWEHFDPYFVVGGGLMFYADDVGTKVDPTVNGGVGAMYHFNDRWAVRGDFRTFIAGFSDTEANSLINVGAVYTLGVDIPLLPVISGPMDSDGDGLTDVDEIDRYGTDPHHPDTDRDDLDDYSEVEKYGTNPLERDTDLDMLTDGEEVYKHETDPLVADTDTGGVSDGHEVLEDGTDPLNGEDDLLLFTLNIEFDTDKAVIKEEYFGDLDKIGKVMARYPGSSAKIEGHADKRRRSSKPYNQKLSKRRANAVLDYLADNWNIDRSRLEALGYGFERPIAPNDPGAGNPLNRRVDVYIDGAVGEPVSGGMMMEPVDDGVEMPPPPMIPEKGLSPVSEKGAPSYDPSAK